VVVVGHGAGESETAAAIRSRPFRYVDAGRPGMEKARNRGIVETRHDIVAFIEDNAVPDPLWLQGIAAGFANPDIAAVTGLVLPAELCYPTQHLCQEYGKPPASFTESTFDGSTMDARGKVVTPAIADSSNMAFRRNTLLQVGAFDAGLDKCASSNGRGEIDLFHRILAAGMKIRYQPSALVWQRYPRGDSWLLRQFYQDERAFGVYLLKLLKTRTVPRRAVLQYAMDRCYRDRLLAHVREGRRKRLPLLRQLGFAEIRGAIHALWAYTIRYREEPFAGSLESTSKSGYGEAVLEADA
jgi:hypothetical protein